MPALSPQAITALVEASTGGSFGDSSASPARYRSGPKVEMLLGNCGINLQLGSASRVPAVRKVLTDINNAPGAVDRLRPLFEAVVHPADYPQKDGVSPLAALVAYLNVALRGDGYALVEQGGLYKLLPLNTISPAAEAVLDAASELTLERIHRDVKRALDSVATDPEVAITSASSMLESICRTIILDLGEPLPSNITITTLYSTASKLLDIAPGRPDLAADLRAILSNLNATVQGIGALRTHAGSAHGTEEGPPRPDERMARLAIHAASAVTEFLILTWQSRKST